jgi:hypothetical protein
MFCAAELIFHSTEGVGSRFNDLRSRTHFHRYRGPRVSYSYFSFLDSFLEVPTVTGLVFMFCSPGLVFNDTEGVGSHFHFWRTRTRSRRFRGRRVQFSCFALHDSFLAVSRVSSPVFMFGAPGLVFGGSEGVGSSFHVSRSRTHFQRHRGRQIHFSSFMLPN